MHPRALASQYVKWERNEKQKVDGDELRVLCARIAELPYASSCIGRSICKMGEEWEAESGWG